MKNNVLIGISIAIISFSVWNGYNGYKEATSVPGAEAKNPSISKKQDTINHAPIVGKIKNNYIKSIDIKIGKLDGKLFIKERDLKYDPKSGTVKNKTKGTLNGIFISNHSKFIVFNNIPAKIGDYVAGGTLVGILKRYIVIKDKAGELTKIKYKILGENK